MSTVVRSNFSAILLALKAQLVERGGLDPSQVLITARDPSAVPHFGAPQDVLLRPMGEQPVEPIIDGSGRIDNRRKRRVQICVRSRVELDPADQDAARLTDASLGHLALEDLVADALELFQPTDAVPFDPLGLTGDALTAAPIRLGALSETRPDKAGSEWVSSSWDLAVEYSRDVGQDLQ